MHFIKQQSFQKVRQLTRIIIITNSRTCPRAEMFRSSPFILFSHFSATPLSPLINLRMPVPLSCAFPTPVVLPFGSLSQIFLLLLTSHTFPTLIPLLSYVIFLRLNSFPHGLPPFVSPQSKTIAIRYSNIHPILRPQPISPTPILRAFSLVFRQSLIETIRRGTRRKV